LNLEERKAIVAALRKAFGAMKDVTPGDGQPLHVLFEAIVLPNPWTSPTRALARFVNWPNDRPEFFVDMSVVNAAGEAPRSNSTQTVLGTSWRQFSFSFPWSKDDPDPVRAIQLWITRFSETT
jgi:hypothetical protein